jgi:hypothetical protein
VIYANIPVFLELDYLFSTGRRLSFQGLLGIALLIPPVHHLEIYLE